MSSSKWSPLVPSHQILPEFTAKSLILGAVLSMMLAFANAYIGLKVGLTVSASIPAAALSMGFLRMFRRSNILENNMVQTSASAGESLAAGIIFTIPALVMMGAWPSYLYVPMVSIGIVGGIMGVAFTIPLRKALIVQAKLAFPEGVATAEVLKTGGIEVDHDHPDKKLSEEGVSGFWKLLQATGIGAGFKFLEGGIGVLAGTVQSTQLWVKGKYLFTGNISISPALIGVGFIVGLNIATLIFIGGTIGTLIGVPLNWAVNSQDILVKSGLDANMSWTQMSPADWANVAGTSWQSCRRIGVGAMMIGGLWSLISLAKPLFDGIKVSLSAYKSARSGNAEAIERTEFDTPIQYVGITAILGAIPIYIIFYQALGELPNKGLIAGLMTLLMLVFGFIFSSVAGYMAGLVGSSNNPISGVTIATVIVSSIVLLKVMGAEGIAGTIGPIAVLYLAGLICSAASIAGDNMQDLKCGHVLGSTPWRQQVYQVVGVIAAALVIPFALNILDQGEGIGRPAHEGQPFLAAPQAGLMRDIATGIFGGSMEWGFVYIGFGLAILLIILDQIQKKRGSSFRFPVLAVAVGIYLPLGLSLTIFVGGVLAHFVTKASRKSSKDVQQSRENRGLLLASGLITGEALMGVAIAFATLFNIKYAMNPPGAAILSLIGLAGVMYYLYRQTIQAKSE
ncbi:MAG: oligopeptide transporter, OPT family [Acidobacteria bacterium]|nr:oligopeptide transporter, OPT family [Acidobacteriota bacterium]MCB9397240.1 oligopeptide transporter, OPT family [Acidobacteriota bacterium]